MRYYLKKLCSQELGSVKDGESQRGRYVYISKDQHVLDFFPHLSKTVKNDSSILPIIPLYLKEKQKIYCSYTYHNDKFCVEKGTRDEYRLYLPKALEDNCHLFRKDDILIFKKVVIKSCNEKEDSFVSNCSSLNDELGNSVYFLYLCRDKESKLYKECSEIIADSSIRGNHAVYDNVISEVDMAIDCTLKESDREFETVIEASVTEKAQKGDIDAMANLFNSTSFRDFVMVGYEYKCAITGNVIRYENFINLEAAHICPRSHKGTYLPSNGIAMCRDMHWAFDKGLFTINDDLTIRVHPDVSSDYLRNYDSKRIFIPKNQFFVPDINNLHYHQNNIYGLFKTSGSLIKAKGYVGNASAISSMVAEEF